LGPLVVIPSRFARTAVHRAVLVGALAAILTPGTPAGAQLPLPELEVVDTDTVTAPTFASTQLRDWQVGFFRRGSSALVVSAFDISRDSVFWQFLTGWGMQKSAAQPLAGWSGEMKAVSRPDPADGLIRGASATLDGKPKAKWYGSMELPWDSVMIRIDLTAPGDPGAMNRLVQAGVTGKAQVVAGPPPQPEHGVQVSDILLYEPDERDPPRKLEGPNGAMSRALGSTALSGRQRMGMFWEVYNLPEGVGAEATLTVIRLLSHGDVRTVLVSDAPSTLDAKTIARLQWTLRLGGTASDILSQGMVLDVGTLSIGRHCAVLTVTVPGQEPVTVVREFRVEVPASR
jgi:hypothetical protein